MAEEFEDFLASALAPPERAPDRRFVGRVQAAIALEERLAVQRASMAREFFVQLLALGAVAAGLWWIGRAAPVADWFAQSPAAGLAVLLVGFAGLVALVGQRSSRAVAR